MPSTPATICCSCPILRSTRVRTRPTRLPIPSITLRSSTGPTAILPAAPPAVRGQSPTPRPSAVETALQQSDWIGFAMLNVTPDVPSSGVIATFLAQRPDLVRSKKIVVFAFDAPYYLDTTDVSKLTG